ncbi:heterokaryon incompatibility protein-domain-containing protein, partial [Phaeosphaeria sp. MPI-PUGE-AT-0046c]
FEHVPLDLHKRSIRLIKILPQRSEDGIIECRMHLSSLKTEYTCLSYVWGEPGAGGWILIDGKRVFVRMNLLNFLNHARPKFQSRYIWIDALCIDQTNIRERQHQVQQMGQIFTAAQEVVSWMGLDEHIATFFSPDATAQHLRWGASIFGSSNYWRRAWITQEIVLGSKVTFMARSNSRSLEALPAPNSSYDFTYNRIIARMTYMRKHFQSSNRPRNALIYLLDDLKFQQCHLKRDRIFSLLGLCTDSSGIMVDYEITDATLALRVLRYHQ